MNCVREARKLADYILGLRENMYAEKLPTEYGYHHIGGLFTDIVLQAGLNYNTVVKPRVQNVLTQYPDASTVKKFQYVINKEGLSNVIAWKHPVKLDRMQAILSLSNENEIDTCDDLKMFITKSSNQQVFLSIKGFGPKTLDYLLMLLNYDNVAVDRHIYSFVRLAEINVNGYEQTKRVVEYAADFLDVPRASLDKCIWKYMSEKRITSSAS